MTQKNLIVGSVVISTILVSAMFMTKFSREAKVNEAYKVGSEFICSAGRNGFFSVTNQKWIKKGDWFINKESGRSVHMSTCDIP